MFAVVHYNICAACPYDKRTNVLTNQPCCAEIVAVEGQKIVIEEGNILIAAGVSAAHASMIRRPPVETKT